MVGGWGCRIFSKGSLQGLSTVGFEANIWFCEGFYGFRKGNYTAGSFLLGGVYTGFQKGVVWSTRSLYGVI